MNDRVGVSARLIRRLAAAAALGLTAACGGSGGTGPGGNANFTALVARR